MAGNCLRKSNNLRVANKEGRGVLLPRRQASSQALQYNCGWTGRKEACSFILLRITHCAVRQRALSMLSRYKQAENSQPVNARHLFRLAASGNLPVNVRWLDIRKADINTYLNTTNYPENFTAYWRKFGKLARRKATEHHIAFTLCRPLSSGQYMDVAADASPVADIFHQHFEVDRFTGRT